MPNVFAETADPLIRTAIETGSTLDEVHRSYMRTVLNLIGNPEARKRIQQDLGFAKLMADEGGSVRSAEAARLYGGIHPVTTEAVRKAANEGALIAVKDGLGNLLFPAWQFAERGGSLPGLKDVLATLRHGHPAYSDLTPLTFLLNPLAILGGKRPLDVLREGRVEEVKRAARETHE